MDKPILTTSTFHMMYLRALRGHRLRCKYKRPKMMFAGVILYETKYVLTAA